MERTELLDQLHELVSHLDDAALESLVLDLLNREVKRLSRAAAMANRKPPVMHARHPSPSTSATARTECGRRMPHRKITGRAEEITCKSCKKLVGDFPRDTPYGAFGELKA